MNIKNIRALALCLGLFMAVLILPSPAHAGWFSDTSCSWTGIGCGTNNPPVVVCGIEYTGIMAIGMRMLGTSNFPCPGPTVNNTPPAPPSTASTLNGTGSTDTTTGTTGTGGTGSESTGSSYTACSSSPNACGMTNLGSLVSGACNAAVPTNSECPAPEISFSASPARVQSGQTTTLNWSATQAVSCALSGGGLSLSGLGLTGSRMSGPITGSTLFTLTCSNGSDGSQKSAQTQVTVIPVYEEI
ncbi:MAG: hypothetical protein JWL87_530 [Candidatus Adlerbacteria bacterium]|nr:hypothetical protein [Candidatus Adlerbacteria bacterium]